MSWHDPHRSKEPASETALREELRGLLGMKPRNYFESEPSPELIALADDLRKEARRRNHTARRRTHWMLLAAALPLAVAFGGVSLWGLAQKHKAEDLASLVVATQTRLARMETTLKALEGQATPAERAQQQPLLTAGGRKQGKAAKGKELVIPIHEPAAQIPGDTQQVKAH